MRALLRVCSPMNTVTCGGFEKLSQSGMSFETVSLAPRGDADDEVVLQPDAGHEWVSPQIPNLASSRAGRARTMVDGSSATNLTHVMRSVVLVVL